MHGHFDRPRSSEMDLKQRHPFLLFYLSAGAFSVFVLLVHRLQTLWQVPVRILSLATAMVALWAFYRLFSLTDERQRKNNQQALQFGFLATLVLALLGGFVRGFTSPSLSWSGILALMLIAWSIGLILYSWRYR